MHLWDQLQGASSKLTGCVNANDATVGEAPGNLNKPSACIDVDDATVGAASANLYKLTVCTETNDATVGATLVAIALHLAFATKVAPTVASKSSSQVWIESTAGF